MKTFFIDRMATPQGELLLIADEENQLRAIDWTDHHDRLMKLLRNHYGADTFTLVEKRNPGGLSESMQRYFAGELSIMIPFPSKQRVPTFSAKSGKNYAKYLVGKLFPMGNWQNALIAPRLLGQLAWPMG